MRWLFLFAVFSVLLGCASNKPIYEETNEDNLTEIVLKHDGQNLFINDDNGREEWIICIVSGIKMQVECYEKAASPSAKELKIKSFYFKDGTTLIIRMPK